MSIVIRGAQGLDSGFLPAPVTEKYLNTRKNLTTEIEISPFVLKVTTKYFY